MDDDDRGLLERIRNGDGESFGVLYDRTRDWLLSFVIVPRVGRDDAEDVLSETYRTALTKIDGFEWRGIGLLHWLATIARRKSQERVRAAQQRDRQESPLTDLFDPPDDVPTAEAQMIRAETLRQTREKVKQTLEAITPRYAQVLRMRLLEGRSRLECAEELAVTPATFDVVLFRATRAFERRWREHAIPG